MLLFCCTVEEMVSEQLETAKNPDLGDVVCVCVASMCCVASQHSDQQNLTNLAPRKIDWDLKRDIAKKLEKLERRTQKAIVEILSELVTDNVYDTGYYLLVSLRVNFVWSKPPLLSYNSIKSMEIVYSPRGS